MQRPGSELQQIRSIYDRFARGRHLHVRDAFETGVCHVNCSSADTGNSIGRCARILQPTDYRPRAECQWIIERVGRAIDAGIAIDGRRGSDRHRAALSDSESMRGVERSQ
jgi:hypothetical protein